MSLFYRLALALIIGLVTFWPGFGLVWLAYENFASYPYAVIVLSCLWAIVLMLILPLNRRQFRLYSTISIAVVFVVGFTKAQTIGWVNVFDVNFYLTWGVAAVFLLFGWLMASTPIWRKIQGVAPVDTSEDGHAHHDVDH